MTSWFSRIGAAVYREYDRRIKRASQIPDDGAHHGHADAHAPAPADDADEGEIINIPRGTPVASPRAEPAGPSGSEPS